MKKKVSALRSVVNRVRSRGYAVRFSSDSRGSRRVTATKSIGQRIIAIKFNASAKKGRRGARSGLSIQSTSPGGAFRGRAVSSFSKIRRDSRGRFA